MKRVWKIEGELYNYLEKLFKEREKEILAKRRKYQAQMQKDMEARQ